MKLGLYVHIPFCKRKCPYCDFYSSPMYLPEKGVYTDCVVSSIENHRNKNLTADTLYFGGGTPILLGYQNVSKIISACSEIFSLDISKSEITLEANPESVSGSEIRDLASSGVNRISMGLQSSSAQELKSLGRNHSAQDVKRAVEFIKSAGITNFSLDIMLGIPGQTVGSAIASAEYCLSLGAPHISAYMLKTEPDTPFYSLAPSLDIPDDDTTADIYEAVSDRLRKEGYNRYEISNFALPGFESAHNLKYWNCEEYLGFGPSAHSFLNGKRFFYPRDFENFILSQGFCEPQFDSEGGGVDEFIMLRLRLQNGFSLAELSEKYPGYSSAETEKIVSSAKKYSALGLVNFDGNRISLTDRGVLVSNSVIAGIML